MLTDRCTGRNFYKAFEYEYYSQLVDFGSIMYSSVISENTQMGYLFIMGCGGNQINFPFFHRKQI